MASCLLAALPGILRQSGQMVQSSPAQCDVPQLGVALQLHSAIRSFFPIAEYPLDAYEVLLDNFVGALDSPYVTVPEFRAVIAAFGERAPLLAHSNYGADFGFKPLAQSAAVRRHVPAAQAIGALWSSNHCFYADDSRADSWSCPVQFSHAEVARLAARANELQALYGMPLLHENPAFYVLTPGAEMPEEEFLARLVEASGTYLLLDLHNLYTNAMNFQSYDCQRYLDTIPLDRVVGIHISGGTHARGVYHAWHENSVPEPVWDMLEHVLRSTLVRAVIVEYQGRGRHDDAQILEADTHLDLIVRDLERAKNLWDRVYGPNSRRTTRVQTESVGPRDRVGAARHDQPTSG